MKIVVHFYASLADSVGTRQLELEVPSDTTVEQLWQQLSRSLPNLERHSRSKLMAVNEEFSRPDRQLAEGDVTAFFPPVSGG